MLSHSDMLVIFFYHASTDPHRTHAEYILYCYPYSFCSILLHIHVSCVMDVGGDSGAGDVVFM